MLVTATTLGFLLATASAVCWGSLDVARKSVGSRMNASIAVAGLMLCQVAIFVPLFILGEFVQPGDDASVFSEILFPGLPTLSIAYFIPAITSVCINLAANWLFLKSVQLSPLSLTTPYLAFTPVFTAIVAFLALNEQPSLWGWIGILIVVFGAFCMNPGARGSGIFAPLKALWTERGSLLMVIVALCWSITPILDKGAAGQTSPLWHTFFIAFGVGTTFLIWSIFREGSLPNVVDYMRRAPVLLFASGLFGVGAMTLQLSSYDFIDVAYVEAVKRAVGLAAAIFAGYLFFGERGLKNRLIGAAIMMVGVAIILFAG